MEVCGRGLGGVALVVLLVASACGGGSSGDGTGADGPVLATPTADGDDGGISIGSELPDYFPSDFYLPDEMTVEGVSRVGDAISMTGTFESGDIAAIQADMVAGLQAAGYELLSNDDIAVFVKNGVGRVRVRTSEFLDALTVSVDIDAWTDAQLDELRDLNAEEITVSGRATAVVGGDTYEAEGQCLVQGSNRSFYASDVSITLQVDETQDPTYVYGDVTTPDGIVYTTEFGAETSYDAEPDQFSARGTMVEYNNEDAGSLSFSITATCDM